MKCRLIDKLDVAERAEGIPGGEGPGGRRGGRGLSPGSRGGAPFGGFLCCSSRYNKVQFFCRSAARETALFLPISDTFLYTYITDLQGLKRVETFLKRSRSREKK